MSVEKARVHDGIAHWLMHGHPGHTVGVPKDGGWTFNGDYVKPTFSPSILEQEDGGHHFFVRDGVVEYLPDKPCACGNTERFWTIPEWEHGDIIEGRRQ